LGEGIFTKMGYSVSELKAAGEQASDFAWPLNIKCLPGRSYPQIHRNLISSRGMGEVVDYTAVPRNGRVIM
jgi:hypothetical protein